MLSLEKAPKGLVVEIGCLREAHERPSDGFSTYYLCRRCLELKVPFKSFDLEPKVVELANEVLRAHDLPQAVELADGQAILPTLGPICCLYLDSSDKPEDTLNQFIAAEFLPGSVVLVDDVQPYFGNRYGKATSLIKHFHEAGLIYKIYPTEPGYKMLSATLLTPKKSRETLCALPFHS